MEKNTAKVAECINQHLMADYLQKLVNVQMSKVVLFPAFPITGAPNLSDPRYYVKINNIEVLSDLLKKAIN